MKALRIIIGIMGVLLALFAGGCSLLIIGDLLFGPASPYVSFGGVLIIGIVPMLFGIFIAWLCFGKYGKK